MKLEIILNPWPLACLSLRCGYSMPFLINPDFQIPLFPMSYFKLGSGKPGRRRRLHKVNAIWKYVLWLFKYVLWLSKSRTWLLKSRSSQLGTPPGSYPPVSNACSESRNCEAILATKNIVFCIVTRSFCRKSPLVCFRIITLAPL